MGYLARSAARGFLLQKMNKPKIAELLQVLEKRVVPDPTSFALVLQIRREVLQETAIRSEQHVFGRDRISTKHSPDAKVVCLPRRRLIAA